MRCQGVPRPFWACVYWGWSSLPGRLPEASYSPCWSLIPLPRAHRKDATPFHSSPPTQSLQRHPRPKCGGSANTPEQPAVLGKVKAPDRAQSSPRGSGASGASGGTDAPIRFGERPSKQAPVTPLPLPAMPVMMMVTPAPMQVPVRAPGIVSPIIVSVRMVAVVSPPHHDNGRRSDHDRCRDTETDGDIDAGLSRLRLRKQGKSQEGDHTPQSYDMGKTFHGHILPV